MERVRTTSKWFATGAVPDHGPTKPGLVNLRCEDAAGSERLRPVRDLHVVHASVTVDSPDPYFDYWVEVQGGQPLPRTLTLAKGRVVASGAISVFIPAGDGLRVRLKRVRPPGVSFNPPRPSPFTKVGVILDLEYEVGAIIDAEIGKLGLGKGWDEDPLDMSRGVGL